MPAKPPNKRNPTDATLRNVRATAKRLKENDKHITWLVTAINKLFTRVQKLEAAAVDAIYLEGRGKRR